MSANHTGDAAHLVTHIFGNYNEQVKATTLWEKQQLRRVLETVPRHAFGRVCGSAALGSGLSGHAVLSQSRGPASYRGGPVLMLVIVGNSRYSLSPGIVDRFPSYDLAIPG